MREILIAGLGSIGRRHLASLRTLGWPHIRLYRSGRSTLPDAELSGIPVDRDLSTALARRPTAVIVSNPTALHIPVALEAARAGAHLFIEKPLSHELAGVAELESLVASSGLTAAVGFQLRFNPGLRQMREWIRSGAIGTIQSAQVHWGEFLPDMHPWEDYRVGYAARSDLGGGVLLTFCHPFDYLRWLIGEMTVESAVESRRDTLQLPVETCVDVTARFACGALAHVHLNFVERPTNHQVRVSGTDGTITWNHADSAVHRYCAASGRCETWLAPDGFEREWMFVDEMRHFLACLRDEEQPLCTLADGRAALETTLAARHALTEDRSSAVA